MSVNPMQEPFFGQNFTFSTNYLDYEIPDFRRVINAAIPVLVYQGAVLSIIEGSLRPLDAKSLGTWIGDIRSRSVKLICNDAVRNSP